MHGFWIRFKDETITNQCKAWFKSTNTFSSQNNNLIASSWICIQNPAIPCKAWFKSTFKNSAEDLQWTSLKREMAKLEIICTCNSPIKNSIFKVFTVSKSNWVIERVCFLPNWRHYPLEWKYASAGTRFSICTLVQHRHWSGHDCAIYIVDTNITCMCNQTHACINCLLFVARMIRIR